MHGAADGPAGTCGRASVTSCHAGRRPRAEASTNTREETLKYLRIAGLGLLLLPAALSPAVAQNSSHDLTIVLDDAVSTLEPCQTTLAVTGLVTRQNVLETLTEVDPVDGNVKPRLATSWEQLPDQSWRVHLREGVNFQDGAPLDAQTFKYSFDRFFNPKISDADCLNRVRFFSDSKMAMKVVDDHTVDLIATPPDPILPLRLSQMVVVSPNTPMDETTNSPVGTGAYTIKSYTPDESVVLERGKSYWGEMPEPETVTYIWRTESAVRAAMGQTGEADIVLGISPIDANNAETDIAYLNSETTRVRFSIGVPPLNDIRVRRAIQLAIDRVALGTLLNPRAELATQTVLPAVFGYNKSLPQPEFNLDEARKLIAEAKADGVPVDTTIRFINRSVLFSNTDEFAQAIQGMLGEIGLNLAYKNLNTPEWIQAMQRPNEDGTPAIFMDSIDNNMGDAIFSIWTRYYSKGNVSDFGSAEFDALYDKAVTAGGDERKALFEQAFQLVHDSAIELPLYHMVSIIRISPRLSFPATMALVQELQLGQVKFKE